MKRSLLFIFALSVVLMAHDTSRTTDALTELTSGNIADADFFKIHDDSVTTTEGAAGETKKALMSSVKTYTSASPTLVTPTIADFSNAGHDHSNAAGGGNVVDAAIPAAITRDTEWDTSAEIAAAVGDETGSGALTFATNPSFTTSINIPNGVDPTTDAEGELAWDTDDDALEVYDGTDSRVIPTLQSATWTILEPDQVQGVSDDVVLKHWNTESYPFGVKIVDIIISGSAAYTAETFLFEEWDDASGTTQATIESIACSAIRTEDDGTLADPDSAADSYLVVNMDDTPEDIAYAAITVTWWVKPGN